MPQLNQELRDFIVENFLFGEPSELAEEDSLLSKGIMDSTGVLELIAFLEERYGISVDDEDTVPENLDSIANLCRFVSGKQAQIGLEVWHAS